MRARDAAGPAHLVGDDHARPHGDAPATHANIAVLWTVYLGTPVTARDAALMVVLLKVARTKTGALDLEDYVAAAGYAATTAEVAGRDV